MWIVKNLVLFHCYLSFCHFTIGQNKNTRSSRLLGLISSKNPNHTYIPNHHFKLCLGFNLKFPIVTLILIVVNFKNADVQKHVYQNYYNEDSMYQIKFKVVVCEFQINSSL